MTGLIVQHLAKRLSPTFAIEDVTFSVRNDEFFVLLGPSGSGKSTLLRLISGLETVDDGRIIINDQDVTNMRPRDRNVGMVFQDFALYPHMSVHGNIAYGLQIRRFSKSEIEKRVAEAAELLNISRLLNRRISELSGGEQQRVALARVMVKDADVYLYDEPLSSLDPKLRFSARRDIMKLHSIKDRPGIYVTHEQEEAFILADRVAVIANGRVQQIDTPRRIHDNPGNLFVAGFIGTPPMNLIQGYVRHEEDHFDFIADEFQVSLPVTWNVALHRHEHARVVLGVRPQQLRLAAPDTPFSFQTTVEAREITPRQTQLTTRFTDKRLSPVLAILAEAHDGLQIGDQVTLAFDPEEIHFFDPFSGENLWREVASRRINPTV